MKKIAIFHWGELTINAYYLAYALKQNDITVNFYLFSPRKAYKRNFIANLLEKVKNEFCVTEFKCSLLESSFIKLYSIINNNKGYVASLSLNPFLPFKTRQKTNIAIYDYVITIGQTSLYWLYKTDALSLSKTIHYSLEIQKVSDPYFITPVFAEILVWESRLLKNVKGLIIQDIFRAEALLNCKIEDSNLKIFYIPVSILRNQKAKSNNYLYTELKIPLEKKVLLYFGAAYTERFLDEISETCEKQLSNSWVLVFHGPDNFSEIIKNNNKIKISNTLLDYDDLHLIMGSASIGLALYDNSWPNTRLTAFSSEKIARYLEVGVPFIAFKNESYDKLKNEFNCCELIRDITGLSAAVEEIMKDYDSYKENCYKAFSKYFDISNSIAPLIQFVNEIECDSGYKN